MTAVNRPTLYGYFVTGSRPTQQQFANLIDSSLNLVETSAQEIVSDVSALGTLSVTGIAAFKSDVSVSGNLSVTGSFSPTSLMTSTLLVTGTTSAQDIHATSLSISGTTSAQNINASGTLIATGTTTPVAGLVGKTDNSSAAIGIVGEIIESTVLVGAAVSITTDTTANITSISLTSGDWDVWGNVWSAPAGGTTTTALAMDISTTSATLSTRPNGGASNGVGSAIAGNTMGVFGQKRLSLSSTTTVYLVTNMQFGVSTMSGYGYIGARRRR